MSEQTEATLTPEEAQSVASRFGAGAKVWEIGGRRWVLRKPTRPQWQAYKCDTLSADPTTKADAGVTLARALLGPFDPSGTVDAERAAFDAMGEEYPGHLDLLGALAEGAAYGPLVPRELKPRPSTPPV